jgi:hypothetical protein
MFGALPGAHWRGEGLIPSPGHLLEEARTYETSAGLVQVYIGGIEVVIVQDSIFRFENGGIALDHGMIAVRSPEGLSGLEITTPFVRFVDIGTTFGIAVNSEGQARVDVFAGKVQAYSTSGALLNEAELGQSTSYVNGTLATMSTADWARYAPSFPLTTRWPVTGPAATRDSGLFGQVLHRWMAGDLGASPQALSWPINHRISGPAILDILVMPTNRHQTTFDYVELLADDQVIWRQKRGTREPGMFRLWLPTYQANISYVMRTRASAKQGHLAAGQVWLKVTPWSSPTLRPPPETPRAKLALHAPATATTTKPPHSAEGNQEPSRAVDGIATYQKNWWACIWPGQLTIELAETKRIDAILCRLHYRHNRGSTYSIETSEDGKIWHEVVTMPEPPLPATRDGDYHRFQPVNARYIRFHALTNTNNEAFHLVELEVYAAE